MTKDEIIKELGIEGASEEAKQDTLESVISLVEVQFGALVEGLLSDEELEELGHLFDQYRLEEVPGWIKEHVPKAEEIYEAVTKEVVATLKQRLS